MPSLLDVAPPEAISETVTFERPGQNPVTLTITGVKMSDMARIGSRFPTFLKRISDGDQNAPIEMTPEAMMDTTAMMPAIIAAGFGTPDEEGERLVKERLTEQEIQDVFNKVMALTVGRGGTKRPFADGQADQDAVDRSGEGQDTSSPKPSTS